MSGELGVYASFLKDSLYATCVAFLFWIAKWDVQWVFFCHALTWAAFPLFYSSDDTGFWAPTGAAIITLVVASLDAFALLNVMCYLPHVDCCIGDDAASPFTLGTRRSGSRRTWRGRGRCSVSTASFLPRAPSSKWCLRRPRRLRPCA